MITDPKVGLTADQAKKYLVLDGPNQITDGRNSSWASILFRQFTSPSISILLLAAAIYGALGNFHDALILFAIIIPSGLLTFAQEFRAASTLQQLRQRLAPTVTTIRDGRPVEIGIESLVRGDVVSLKAGDPVPADLIVLESDQLFVDESLLTGESLPVEMQAGSTVELYKGTFISSGKVLAQVIRTGTKTRFGEIAHRLSERDPETSFEKGIRRFGAFVARAILALVILVFLGNLALDRPVFSSLLFSLALAVGLTPQMLPVIISICLSRGARDLAAEKVLVRRLDAIEDLGSLEVLCTDKTGTLTEGTLHLHDHVDPLGKKSDRVLMLAYENAFHAASANSVIDRAIMTTSKPPVPRKKKSVVPFTFERRMVTVVMDDGEAITKGAVNEVMAISTQARIDETVVNLDQVGEQIKRLHEEMITSGFKVLAIASSSEGKIEQELIFEGFLAISDPIKEDAKVSVDRLRNLGVRVVLVTGDNLGVATHIASGVGISTSRTVTGRELEKLNADQLGDLVEECDLFAEVNPLQKVAIVDALKARGHATGFLGDGINDAMALKSSDVSISVDDASEIARGVSSVVLLEKSLQVIADGVILGRKTYLNTMKYIKITISASFGNVLSMALASLFLPFLPMLPTQILLLNFLSDLPAIAISSDSVDEEASNSPRSWSMRGLGHFMLFFGLISTVFDLLLFFTVLSLLDGDATELRSLWFVTSLITEAIAIYTLRTSRHAWQSKPSTTLFSLALFVILLSFLLPTLGLLTGIGIAAPSLQGIFLILALALGYFFAVEISKFRARSWIKALF